jgi:hypothetical protein
MSFKDEQPAERTWSLICDVLDGRQPAAQDEVQIPGLHSRRAKRRELPGDRVRANVPSIESSAQVLFDDRQVT